MDNFIKFYIYKRYFYKLRIIRRHKAITRVGLSPPPAVSRPQCLEHCCTSKLLVTIQVLLNPCREKAHYASTFGQFRIFHRNSLTAPHNTPFHDTTCSKSDKGAEQLQLLYIDFLYRLSRNQHAGLFRATSRK